MQLLLYRSQITIQFISLFLLPVASSTAVAPENSTIQLFIVRVSLGKVFISSTKLFA